MFTFTLTPDDGEALKVRAGSRDVYMWEKTHRDKTFAQLMSNMAMVDLYEIAHTAARREKQFAGNLQEFVATYELATEEDEAEQATPFDQDPSAGTSSPSPSSQASPPARGSKKATKR